MALGKDPSLLIADEPTTALDVTIQAQILDLMKEVKNHREEAAIVLITHDLAVVAETCEKVTVLYAGKDVETGTVDNVLFGAKHPYTKALLEASPSQDSRGKRLRMIPGKLPNSFIEPSGCSFIDRCPKAMEICKQKIPIMERLEKDHKVACFLYIE